MLGPGRGTLISHGALFLQAVGQPPTQPYRGHGVGLFHERSTAAHPELHVLAERPLLPRHSSSPMPVIITAKLSPPCSMMRAPEPSLDAPSRAANTRTGCASIFDAVELGNRQSAIVSPLRVAVNSCPAAVGRFSTPLKSAIVNPGSRSRQPEGNPVIPRAWFLEVGSDQLDGLRLHLGSRKEVDEAHSCCFRAG